MFPERDPGTREEIHTVEVQISFVEVSSYKFNTQPEGRNTRTSSNEVR